MFTIGVGWFILAESMGIGSQWYTSTGALLLGMWLAKNEFSFKTNNIMIVVNLVLIMISVYLSKLFVNVYIIKDLMTLISGIFFTCFFVTFGRAIEAYTNVFSKKDWVSIIGTNSLWIYITHMLVLEYITDTKPFLFLIFVICAIMVAMALEKVYRLLEICLSEIFTKQKAN